MELLPNGHFGKPSRLSRWVLVDGHGEPREKRANSLVPVLVDSARKSHVVT